MKKQLSILLAALIAATAFGVAPKTAEAADKTEIKIYVDSIKGHDIYLWNKANPSNKKPQTGTTLDDPVEDLSDAVSAVNDIVIGETTKTIDDFDVKIYIVGTSRNVNAESSTNSNFCGTTNPQLKNKDLMMTVLPYSKDSVLEICPTTATHRVLQCSLTFKDLTIRTGFKGNKDVPVESTEAPAAMFTTLYINQHDVVFDNCNWITTTKDKEPVNKGTLRCSGAADLKDSIDSETAVGNGYEKGNITVKNTKISGVTVGLGAMGKANTDLRKNYGLNVNATFNITLEGVEFASGINFGGTTASYRPTSTVNITAKNCTIPTLTTGQTAFGATSDAIAKVNEKDRLSSEGKVNITLDNCKVTTLNLGRNNSAVPSKETATPPTYTDKRDITVTATKGSIDTINVGGVVVDGSKVVYEGAVKLTTDGTKIDETKINRTMANTEFQTAAVLEFKNVPTTDTADYSTIALWSVLALVSAAAYVVLSKKSRA